MRVVGVLSVVSNGLLVDLSDEVFLVLFLAILFAQFEFLIVGLFALDVVLDDFLSLLEFA